jgi:hypothetical protein
MVAASEHKTLKNICRMRSWENFTCCSTEKGVKIEYYLEENTN